MIIIIRFGGCVLEINFNVFTCVYSRGVVLSVFGINAPEQIIENHDASVSRF